MSNASGSSEADLAETPQGLWGALRGVRVLELCQNAAGPFASEILVMLGADVVKLESGLGDVSRAIGRPREGGVSAVYATLNHGKRSVSLDLKHPDSRPVLQRLVLNADVVLQNLRPGTAARLGLGVDDVHAINPTAIYCSVAGLYPSEADRPGYDVIAQAESGIMDRIGEEGSPPARVPLPMLDYATAMWAAIGILAGLKTERRNLAINVTLLDVAMAMQCETIAAYLADGVVPRRRGSGLEAVTPHRAFATSDGHILVAAGNDSLYGRLAAVLGSPLDDARFSTTNGRMTHRDELEAAISEKLCVEPTATWFEILHRAGIPVAPIRGLSDAVDRHIAHSSTGVRRAGGFDVLAPPLEVSGNRWEPQRDPATLGSDTSEVLSALGFTDNEIGALIASGVLA